VQYAVKTLYQSLLFTLGVLALARTGVAQVPSSNDTTPSGTATFKTLHSFLGTDGSSPLAGLIQGTNGDFYGTTSWGGTYDEPSGGGTVFKIAPSGLLETLYNFCAQTNCTDGRYPAAALIQGTDGGFYGTTEAGGVTTTTVGFGTVFKIAPGGLFTRLHRFCTRTNCPDGGNPFAGLIQATDGDFYGTTFGWGPGNSDGTVFKITPSGTLTTVLGFDGLRRTDGIYPFGGVIQTTDGDFYGTTLQGGTQFSGTVYKITDGTLTTLYTFCSQALRPHCTDGAAPQGNLIQAADGNFYGTTSAGGTTDITNPECQDTSCGTVFKITPGGSLTVLHKFCTRPNCPDGAAPMAGLIQATDGNFYGTTSAYGAHGGASSGGTIFRITPGGTLTTLHSFCAESNCPDGSTPMAGLMQATNGDFYGTTLNGGPNSCVTNGFNFGCGTVFRLSVGLGPFVQTQTSSGTVGSAVKILGTDLTGASSVTFNGTTATFTVVSASEISTTVPAGATTGFVEVMIPGGTLTSNKTFTVTL
jgi:uncharacterized repeat protein (TIGR03803 family)